MSTVREERRQLFLRSTTFSKDVPSPSHAAPGGHGTHLRETASEMKPLMQTQASADVAPSDTVVENGTTLIAHWPLQNAVLWLTAASDAPKEPVAQGGG